jgi:hypothetical protein
MDKMTIAELMEEAFYKANLKLSENQVAEDITYYLDRAMTEIGYISKYRPNQVTKLIDGRRWSFNMYKNYRILPI